MNDVPPCSHCGLKFALHKEHYTLVHLGEKEIRCLFCAYLFDTMNALFIHIIQHDGSVCCFFCKERFNNYEILLEHINSHTELHVYGCKECCWTCANRITFLEHNCGGRLDENSGGLDSGRESSSLRIRTPSNSDSANKEILNVNNVFMSDKFRDKNRLKFMASCLKSDGYYQCSICPKQFKTSRGFKFHLFKHNDLLKFVCKECGKKFPSNTKLKEHSELHSMKIQYPCGECGKLYKTKYSLAIHFMTHRGGFICAHCSAKFSRKHHVKLHLNVKKCCGEIFRCRSLYVEHIQKALHIFRCEHCSSRFASDVDLTRHQSFGHRNILGTHECIYCGFLCLSANNLARHKRRSCGVIHRKEIKMEIKENKSPSP